MRRIALSTAAAAALAFAAPAQATITTINYTLSGDGTGTLALDFDNNTSTYSLADLDLTIGLANFTEANSDLSPPGQSLLELGGNPGGYGVLIGGTDDFNFAFNPIVTSQTVNLFTITPTNDFPPVGALTITQSGPRSALPEPTTWLMMLIGFGTIGLATRRRRVRATA